MESMYIDTWLGRLEAVFEPEPFCLSKIVLPEPGGGTRLPDRGLNAEKAGTAGPALKLGGMILDYFERARPIQTPWHWLDLDCMSALQRRVLEIVAGIPMGRTLSYGRVAHVLGRPGAARFVGNTMAANPYPILIPCHRVVKAGGAAGGFGGGTEMKEKLLGHEGAEP